MDIVRDENAGLCTLCFNGNLTVDSVVELKEALLGALETSDDLCINLEGATQVDLACLQVLCSAHMTAVGMDKQLQLMKPLPDALRQAVSAAGYMRRVSCFGEDSPCCLWHCSHYA